MARTVGGLLAIETGVKAVAKRAETDGYHLLQKSPLLNGYSKVYAAKDPDATEWDNPPNEGVVVQVEAEAVLQDVAKELAKWFDITATRDLTNAHAYADLMVGDVPLLQRVPITYLMFLERVLVDLGTFVGKLPVLDPAEAWRKVEGSTAWASAEEVTMRTKKIPRNHVMQPATDKHPAQVTVYQEDTVIGKWTRIKFSGAVPAQRVADMVARVRELQDAVKLARDEANRTALVMDLADSGSKILGYVLG